MEFHLTRKQGPRKGQWLLPQPPGEIICYEEPLHHELLPKLMSALQKTKWPYQFHGYFYRLRTKSELIEEFVPASEHYKISWRAMSQKFHGTILALRSVESIANELSTTYLSRHSTVGELNQPKLSFSTELYRLRTDFSTVLFLIRSTLDQFASLVQFLTGPTSRKFSSFADLMTKCRGNSPPVEVPPELRKYLTQSCDWFWRMRDVRDYIAHHGFVSLHLVQSPANELKFYIHDRLDLLELACEFTTGFELLLTEIDTHYSRRIRDA